MKELTDFDSQRMHTQLVGRADFKELVAHRELLRFRKINAILWILFAVGLILTYVFWKLKITKFTLLFGIVSIVILLALAIRYGWTKKIKTRNSRVKDGWERIDRLPSWAYRRMKKKRKNIVRGKHHLYKWEANKFYRKKR